MSLICAHLLILGLDPSASTAELKAAYRREISKWHPDRFHGDPANQSVATERAKKINAAYEYLAKLHKAGDLPHSTPRSSATQPPKSQKTYRRQHAYNWETFTPGFPDPNVSEVFVKSSHIVSTGYNRRTGTLYIKFGGNAIYSYFRVPESVFSAFMSAGSHGKFAHRNIYGQYESMRH